MNDKSIHKILWACVITMLIVIFSYFRLLPIYNQTVPYTFDQGRDFLRVADIVKNHNFTLIGPATGAGGVFHGAWWYYFLSIPFIIFKGNPSGFYIFITLTVFVQTVLFSLFLKRKWGNLAALSFFSFIAISPYFISRSIFAINSFMTLPFILLFLYALYSYLEKESFLMLALIMFSLGMIMESELAFGMFIIPSFIITIVALHKVKYFFGSTKKTSFAILGFVLPVIPRLLFELRNNFFQTKSMLRFAGTPGTHPSNIQGLFVERMELFRDYFIDVFPQSDRAIATIIGIMALLGLMIGYKKFNKTQKAFVQFISILIALLFILSLVYKDNFFWAYYFEGIQHFFLVLLVIGLYGLTLSKDVVHQILSRGAVVLLILFSVVLFYRDITHAKDVPVKGLRMHTKVLDYIYDDTQGNDFCIKIYTPPVFPHTYNYILNYYQNTKGYSNPSGNFVENTCYFVVEGDPYSERLQKWREEKIPENADLIKKEDISNSVSVELWKRSK